ncbi:serine hydrolase [Candidatus Daviesbacteria bacterium]|nr:serine hydrolase [Candidatus Daviesbacteria bacterium]
MEIIPGPKSWQIKRKNSSKLKIYFLLLIFVISLFLIKHLSSRINFASLFKSSDNLKQVVDQAFEGNSGTYGVVIKNFRTNESYQFNEHKVFETGSLYKLWIMAEVFRQLQEGRLKEDEILSSEVDRLNKEFNLSSDSAELTDGEITLSVKDALNQMITISHNYAALLLTEKLKLSSVAAYLKNIGLQETKVGTDGSAPISTPFDIALFFEKLYKNQLADQETSQKMIELLKKQTLNNKLPKNLPQEVSIAHKTGELGYLTHDSGIVFTPKGDYIIVILSESDFPPGAEDRIAQVSKAVYDYFTK